MKNQVKSSALVNKSRLINTCRQETGDIDFEYIPSDYDVIEKVKKSRQDRSGKDKRRPKSDNHKDHKKTTNQINNAIINLQNHLLKNR